ncbi:MAG: flagellar hook-basal body complex protein FliE [Zetaproteobacteria bacterium]|nr:MAG: flagellar hook-basal body complex protein FliE [Zetaproteobacteria bacterium]
MTMQTGSVTGQARSMPMPSVGGRKQNQGGFAAMIRAYTRQVNHDVKAASRAATEVAMGKGGDTTEVLLALQKASLSFQLMVATRNKLVEAYREVMRMQV